jgi:signal transduction histidine kinase
LIANWRWRACAAARGLLPSRPNLRRSSLRWFRRCRARHLQFECAVAAGARLPFDRTDLAEVLGNILENAAHHARSKVQVTATLAPLGIAIDDDGDGIPEDQVARVLERGGRLDQRGAGAGLGLSIVRQVLDAYGWHLQIGRSELGGVRAKIAPNPAAASRVMHAETVSS